MHPAPATTRVTLGASGDARAEDSRWVRYERSG